MHRPAVPSRLLIPPSRVLALLLAALAPFAVRAETPEKRQAQGSIESKTMKFEARGAYAFPAKVGLDDEPGIKVAISNAGFIEEALDHDYDREYMIDNYFRDDETLVAYFQFSKTGAYKGVSYAFASGDGCGLCYDGSAQSTIKVDGGRIHGSLKLAKPDSLAFDVSFDVPVAPSDYGDPLPAGGGEPGKAYTALHGPMVAWDYAAAKPFFTEETQADWKDHSQEILESFRKDHPTVSFRVVRGWVRGDRALLLVEGEATYGKVKSEAQLVRQKGTWRLSSEVMQMRIGE
ncbi:MAG: hypothetical protein IPJ17_10275 [Holophagales bacterium]|nr:MAG: hypothetical protein IPJ17_10275 [Holophagales bacterium]